MEKISKTIDFSLCSDFPILHFFQKNFGTVLFYVCRKNHFIDYKLGLSLSWYLITSLLVVNQVLFSVQNSVWSNRVRELFGLGFFGWLICRMVLIDEWTRVRTSICTDLDMCSAHFSPNMFEVWAFWRGMSRFEVQFWWTNLGSSEFGVWPVKFEEVRSSLYFGSFQHY